MYYCHSSLKRIELSFTGATVHFFHVDGSFCCDFDLFGPGAGVLWLTKEKFPSG